MTYKFSNLEIQILELLLESKNNAEIAEKLRIKLDELLAHINLILFKLNAQSKTEAVIKAIKASIISLKKSNIVFIPRNVIKFF